MRFPKSFLTVATAACVIASHAAEAKVVGGWRNIPLVKNGKLSSDWVQIGFGDMVVEGDSIRTEPASEGLGLFTYRKERVGNCQIRVVFKAKNERANSGVYVRIADGILDQVKKPGSPFDRDANGKISDASMEKAKAAGEREEGPWYAVHNGYEVQIAGGGDELHRTGAIYSLAKSTSIPKPGEWQTLIITLDGTKISVDLDGKAVSHLDTASKDLPKRTQWHEPKRENKRPEVGYFGLQTHDPGDIVWFKEVSIRPLSKR
jgi:hypothetical protein